MKLNSKKLGQFVEVVDERNSENISENLLGISIDKKFIKSVANTVGTDLTKYKLLKKGFFACNTMHVGRDKRLPVALYNSAQPAIISPAYCTFKVVDNNILDPEYLKLVFSSAAFDHECWFRTDGDIRGGLSWVDLCNIDLSIPTIEQQRKIVWMYQTVKKRIKLKEAINDNLEKQIHTLYNKFFIEDKKEEWKQVPLPELIFFQEGPGIRNWQYVEQGVRFINIRCIISGGEIDTKTANMISEEEAYGKYKHFLLEPYDIVMSCSGTLGRCAIVLNNHLPLCLNTSVIRFRPLKFKEDYSFVYGYMTSKEFLNQQLILANGSAQVNFGPTHLRKILIAEPPIELRKTFNDIVMPIINEKIKIRQEISQLIKLRDNILSFLLTNKNYFCRF